MSGIIRLKFYNSLGDEMRFSKTNDIYKIIRMTGSQNNILGVSFSEGDVREDNINVIEWSFGHSEKFLSSKEEILKQVISGLRNKNENLKTDYKLSKIYFSPSDSPSNSVYRLLICKLIDHYHSGGEFEEV
jgi:hypothetical protein